MKKWLRFFCVGFFSDRISMEGAKRGYTNFLLALILALLFLWAGYVGGDMLPMMAHYKNSPDLISTVETLFANADPDIRIDAEIKDGVLLAGKGGEYTACLLVNTLENEADRQNYSACGYDVVVDTRPADALAEFEAYYLSNDGQNLKISYEEYLSLGAVAKMNFDFHLDYTGNELKLTDEMVLGYLEYLTGIGKEVNFTLGEMTTEEYNRAVYELYFESYYPEITSYESTSKVPLLRNYYYHNYISQGLTKYLFIFDDYMTVSFETNGGISHSFYGFCNNMDDGAVCRDGSTEGFIKGAIHSIAPLTIYAYAMNIFSLIPFIALMPLVVTLLAYSILKLSGIESIKSFGAMFKILGSYVWMSGLVSALLTLILSFFLQPNIVSTLPLVLFFVTLAVRSVIFAVREVRSFIKQTEEETVLREA
jgi:hypothetical protein